MALLGVEVPIVDALDRLRAAGLRIALVSDAGADDVEWWDRSPLSSRFDVEVFSYKVGVRKPDPRIYRHALDGLGVAPGMRCSSATVAVTNIEERARPAFRVFSLLVCLRRGGRSALQTGGCTQISNSKTFPLSSTRWDYDAETEIRRLVGAVCDSALLPS
jgi:FMN phosphatase YigB (HAD superfamily)